MKKLNLKIIGILTLLLVFSCKTYTVPINSFRDQMVNANSIGIKEVKINNPLTFGKIKYSSNNIDQLIVLDKNGNKMYLKNSPSIEIRVTHRNGKKHKLYFDTVILENNTLVGKRSRFAQGLKYEIPMDSIVKIEIQDGGKKFKYNN